MKENIPHPKFKIGWIVIAKGWFFWNMYEIVGASLITDEWHYLLKICNNSWFPSRVFRPEDDIKYISEKKG